MLKTTQTLNLELKSFYFPIKSKLNQYENYLFEKINNSYSKKKKGFEDFNIKENEYTLLNNLINFHISNYQMQNLLKNPNKEMFIFELKFNEIWTENFEEYFKILQNQLNIEVIEKKNFYLYHVKIDLDNYKKILKRQNELFESDFTLTFLNKSIEEKKYLKNRDFVNLNKQNNDKNIKEIQLDSVFDINNNIVNFISIQNTINKMNCLSNNQNYSNVLNVPDFIAFNKFFENKKIKILRQRVFPIYLRRQFSLLGIIGFFSYLSLN